MTRVFQGCSRDRDLISRAEHRFERRETCVSLLVNKPYRQISQFLVKLSERSTVNKSTARNSRYILSAYLAKPVLHPWDVSSKNRVGNFFFFFFPFLFYVAGRHRVTRKCRTREYHHHTGVTRSRCTINDPYLIYPFPSRGR